MLVFSVFSYLQLPYIAIDLHSLYTLWDIQQSMCVQDKEQYWEFKIYLAKAQLRTFETKQNFANRGIWCVGKVKLSISFYQPQRQCMRMALYGEVQFLTSGFQ